MTYAILAGTMLVAIGAMAAILYRLFVEYERDTLTGATFLVGGFLLALIFGLFVAGVQVLVQGPGR